MDCCPNKLKSLKLDYNTKKVMEQFLNLVHNSWIGHRERQKEIILRGRGFLNSDRWQTDSRVPFVTEKWCLMASLCSTHFGWKWQKVMFGNCQELFPHFTKPRVYCVSDMKWDGTHWTSSQHPVLEDCAIVSHIEVGKNWTVRQSSQWCHLLNLKMTFHTN